MHMTSFVIYIIIFLIIKQMDDISKRIFLFLGGCITTRLLLVYMAYTFAVKNSWLHLQVMGFLALIPALGFAIIYLGQYRKTGPEVFGDRIWWNDLRPVHAALYAIFAYMAITKNKHAWKVLLVDVVIGLTAFIVHHRVHLMRLF